MASCLPVWQKTHHSPCPGGTDNSTVLRTAVVIRHRAARSWVALRVNGFALKRCLQGASKHWAMRPIKDDSGVVHERPQFSHFLPAHVVDVTIKGLAIVLAEAHLRFGFGVWDWVVSVLWTPYYSPTTAVQAPQPNIVRPGRCTSSLEQEQKKLHPSASHPSNVLRRTPDQAFLVAFASPRPLTPCHLGWRSRGCQSLSVTIQCILTWQSASSIFSTHHPLLGELGFLFAVVEY